MYSYLACPTATHAVMERYSLVAKRRLGQNFLVSDAVVGRILALADLSADDVVYEVGPGIGTLTVALLPRAAAVVAVEADRSLCPVLVANCKAVGGSLSVVTGDATRITLGELSVAADRLPTKLVANLPYQVAATVLMRVFEQVSTVGRAVVMVQSEVADRIAAVPGSKAYGAYTVKLALRGRVSGRFDVAPGSFSPKPHVRSSVVRVDRRLACDPGTGMPLSPAALAQTIRVVDGAFAQRRKTIRNSLVASGFARADLDEALARAGIDPSVRAETLAPSAFMGLAAALADMPGEAEGSMCDAP